MVRGNHPHPFDAAGDAGNLLFNITYPRDIKGGMLLETACTDESRFGFHTLAPVVDKSQGSGLINTLNFGSLADPLKLPSVYNNPFVYYTRN
jgi:hypothetical protein